MCCSCDVMGISAVERAAEAEEQARKLQKKLRDCQDACSFDARNKVPVLSQNTLPVPSSPYTRRHFLGISARGGKGGDGGWGSLFTRFCQAKELEFENKQLRRTISSLAKATAAERETYLALQSDLESYQDIVNSIAQEYDFTRSCDRVYGCSCAGGLVPRLTISQPFLLMEQKSITASRGEAAKAPSISAALE